MGINKSGAREAAQAWWDSPASQSVRDRGYGICDSCSTQLPVGSGFLCNPKDPMDSTPDSVCERCFEATSRYEPWDPVSWEKRPKLDWIPQPQCPQCGALYNLRQIHPPVTATHIQCISCKAPVPLNINADFRQELNDAIRSRQRSGLSFISSEAGATAGTTAEQSQPSPSGNDRCNSLFDVVLTSPGPNKTSVIAIMQCETGIDFAVASNFAFANEILRRSSYPIIRGVSSERAEKVKTALNEIGAEAEIQPRSRLKCESAGGLAPDQLDWIDFPECPECGVEYELQALRPPATATHVECIACGTQVPVRTSH